MSRTSSTEAPPRSSSPAPRGRGYGHSHGQGCDDPNPGPLPYQTYAALVGGPLERLLLGIMGWRPEEVDDGAALTTA
ncbi:hypothetical protein GTY51_24900 [Streptomyces sp. SID4936]|uniref:hypothetical protein n=1 Tax=unclassified Streptomyces TaxID=2593676 RepID=UPI000B862599|nr:hypothetical protein [Streptomyces sp. DvalAA-43]MYQ86786.1 hypothetical protein [Streptomyces sp. SID4936]